MDAARASALFLEESLDLVFEVDRQEREQGTHAQHDDRTPGEHVRGRRQLMQSFTGLNKKDGRQGHAGERPGKERAQRNVENRRADVDEPIGQDGCDAEKDHEPNQTVRVRLNLVLPFGDLRAEVFQEQMPAEELREEITKAGAQRRAQAHEKQGQRKRVEESSQDTQKYRARYGERL